jgi:hypothetical protein
MSRWSATVVTVFGAKIWAGCTRSRCNVPCLRGGTCRDQGEALGKGCGGCHAPPRESLQHRGEDVFGVLGDGDHSLQRSDQSVSFWIPHSPHRDQTHQSCILLAYRTRLDRVLLDQACRGTGLALAVGQKLAVRRRIRRCDWINVKQESGDLHKLGRAKNCKLRGGTSLPVFHRPP